MNTLRTMRRVNAAMALGSVFVLCASLTVVAGCYDRSSVAPCVLTCNASAPCPDEMICGAEQLCRPASMSACVPADSAVDDATDTVPDSLLDGCPASYTITLPSTAGTSKYRTAGVPSATDFWALESECREVAGLTHLIVAQTNAELQDMFGVVAPVAPVDTVCFVGAVQSPAATTVAGDWIRLDGAPLDTSATPWAAGRPADGFNDEATDPRYNLAGFPCNATEPALFDVSGRELGVTLCECDGTPIAATARMYIDNDPNL